MNSVFSSLATMRVSDGVAVGALASPFWLPWLQSLSEATAIFLPILGVAWLIIQMYYFVKDRK